MSDSIDIESLPAVDDLTRRDRWGRYLVVPPRGGEPVGYTRATTVAKVLDSGGGLADWKAAMTVTGMLMRPGLRARWEALMAQQNGDPWYNSQEGKAQCKNLVTDCATVGGASDRAQIGLGLHAITALIDGGKVPAHLAPETRADVDAYVNGLDALGIRLVPGAVEVTVVLDTYQVAGTFDRLALAPGRELPKIADLKTGANLDYSWQSFAVQLAIYSRAEAIYEQGAARDGSQDVRHPMPAVDQDYGLIFWLNAGTAKLEVYEVDLNAGWEAFSHSMWTRGWRNRRDVSRTLEPPRPSLERQLEESLAALKPTIVATAQSRRGGKLDCGHMARAGESIFKLDTGERGGTTTGGNGLGGWVCLPCAHGQPAPELAASVAHHPSGAGSTEQTARTAPASAPAPDPVQAVADEFASQLPPLHVQADQEQADWYQRRGLYRVWLQERIDAIGRHPQARTALGRAWPPDTPPLKHSDTHTSDQLGVIEALLDDVERRYELPFGPPNPLEKQAVAKVLDLFPASTITTNPPGDKPA